MYMLNHSELPAEIERLEWNHRNMLVPVMGNYLVPPDVEAYLQDLIKERTVAPRDGTAPVEPPVSVVDVGTGTGVWLVDLASNLPPTARLDGFDINTTKFRPASALPPNVSLQHANALEPFPAALHEQYDLVHVRLLVLGLKPADWQPIAQNIMALLRPGGYLVWEEVDTANFRGVPETSAVAQVMNRMLRFSRARGQTVPYPLGLHELLASVGYEDAHQQAFKGSDYWETDPVLTKNLQFSIYTIAASYLQGIVESGGFEDIQTKEDAVRLTAQVKECLDSGAGKGDSCYWRTMARKPLSKTES